MKKTVRVAAIQMPIAGEEDRESNISSALELVGEAGRRECDIAVLPELFSGLKSRGTLPGQETDRLGPAARKFGMYVVAPFYVLFDEGGTYNCSVLLDRSGRIAGVYRKVHLWPWEAPVDGISAGEQFPVFETDFGMIGLCICHDHQFPETARLLAIGGAELVICSTRMPDPFQLPWLELSRIRALENQAYVISAGAASNECSTHIVRPTFRDAVIVAAGGGKQIITADVDLAWLRAQRSASPLYRYPESFPSPQSAKCLAQAVSHCFLKERRPQLYGGLSE